MRSRVEAAALFAFRLMLLPFPIRLVPLLGEALGAFLFHVARLKRRLTLSNLELALGPQVTLRERTRIAARCYRHFGGVVAEFLALPRLKGRNMADFHRMDNPEVLDRALAAGKGLLIAAGHLGNWELFGCDMTAQGYGFTIYVGQQHNLRTDAAMNSIRQGMGLGTVPKGTAAMRGMMRVLKSNQVLGMLSDQHFSRNRHFVRFFGHVVSVAPGLGLLAVRLGTPVVFAETWKESRFCYRTRFHPLDTGPPSGNGEYDLLHVTQLFMDHLAEAARRHPEQYFWMHRRWREPPPEESLSPANRAFLAGAPPPPDDGGDAIGGEDPEDMDASPAAMGEG